MCRERELCLSILLYLGEKKNLSLHAELKKDLIYVTATLPIPPEVSLISAVVRQIKIHLRVQYLAAVELLLTR